MSVVNIREVTCKGCCTMHKAHAVPMHSATTDLSPIVQQMRIFYKIKRIKYHRCRCNCLLFMLSPLSQTVSHPPPNKRSPNLHRDLHSNLTSTPFNSDLKRIWSHQVHSHPKAAVIEHLSAADCFPLLLAFPLSFICFINITGHFACNTITIYKYDSKGDSLKTLSPLKINDLQALNFYLDTSITSPSPSTPHSDKLFLRQQHPLQASLFQTTHWSTWYVAASILCIFCRTFGAYERVEASYSETKTLELSYPTVFSFTSCWAHKVVFVQNLWRTYALRLLQRLESTWATANKDLFDWIHVSLQDPEWSRHHSSYVEGIHPRSQKGLSRHLGIYT